MDSAVLDQETLARRKQICHAFFQKKTKLYSRVNRCENGNIVTIRNFFRWDSHYYVVTDPIRNGITDPAVIAVLDEEKKRAFFRQLLYCICALHKEGIVHADLKTDNLLLKQTAKGTYAGKIVDFDSGFLVGSEPDSLQGDFVYLAPEAFLRQQKTDIPLTEKIDIFALGILLHQYWTGSLPSFQQGNYLFEAVLQGERPVLNQGIPEDIRGMVEQMLALDPESRPDAQTLFQRLKPERKELPPEEITSDLSNGGISFRPPALL